MLWVVPRILCAPPPYNVFILKEPGISPFVVYKGIVWSINMVEARIDSVRFDTLAYNRKSGATGAFQITKVRLDDYNKRNKTKYRLRDCYNYEISLKIFLYYASGTDKEIAYGWYGLDKNTYSYWKSVEKWEKIYLQKSDQ
jgi:hypothetical protein